jgi:hypothetical protein
LFDAVRAGLGQCGIIISATVSVIPDWRTHFGSRWRQLQSAKQEFDPYGILAPGYGIVSTS